MPSAYDQYHLLNSLRPPSSYSFAGCGYQFLCVPLTPERSRFVSSHFPWTSDISPNAREGNVNVLAAWHAVSQLPLTNTEYDTVTPY
ncbi:hypothetical protein BDR04DRAFT_1093584 [Suillus decipiens]|nr:hypothetical protein BDR04DRAFT_1093584 [Suillus decipiens]